MTIYGGSTLHGARLPSYGDHRIAMAFAIAGLFATGSTIIEDTACVRTSYPQFESILMHIQRGDNTLWNPTRVISSLPDRRSPDLGPMKMVVAIDGPAASGKSSVAREVSSRLSYSYIDSGAFYRTITWWILRNNADPASTEQVAALVAESQIESGSKRRGVSSNQRD